MICFLFFKLSLYVANARYGVCKPTVGGPFEMFHNGVVVRLPLVHSNPAMKTLNGILIFVYVKKSGARKRGRAEDPAITVKGAKSLGEGTEGGELGVAIGDDAHVRSSHPRLSLGIGAGHFYCKLNTSTPWCMLLLRFKGNAVAHT